MQPKYVLWLVICQQVFQQFVHEGLWHLNQKWLELIIQHTFIQKWFDWIIKYILFFSFWHIYLPFLVFAPIFNRHGQLMRVLVLLETWQIKKKCLIVSMKNKENYLFHTSSKKYSAAFIPSIGDVPVCLRRWSEIQFYFSQKIKCYSLFNNVPLIIFSNLVRSILKRSCSKSSTFAPNCNAMLFILKSLSVDEVSLRLSHDCWIVW